MSERQSENLIGHMVISLFKDGTFSVSCLPDLPVKSLINAVGSLYEVISKSLNEYEEKGLNVK